MSSAPRARSSRSIRRRLLIGLTGATVTLWLLVIGATYFGANREVDALFDTQLEQSAKVATRTLLGLPVPEDETAGEPGDQYKKNLVIQVWDADGELIVHSRNAPRVPLNGIDSGFADSDLLGERWRTYAFHDAASGLTIRAGEPYRPRDYLTRHVVTQTMYPVLIGLPVVTLMIWVIVGRGFGPLRRLAAEVHRRDPDNLDGIEAPYAPAEVRPLLAELNVLLGRLKQKIDNERHFVADAAHELRTPLSGLKAQAQVALGARSDDERDHALNSILVGVDRASHLVNQLLTLSRLDESTSIVRERVDLASTVRTVILDSLADADRQGIELTFDAPSGFGASIRGNAEAIHVLVRNLVDNAVKYSPADTVVTLSISTRSDRLLLSVGDQGPGIPAAERDKVFDRFHRRTGGDAYGSGLGLSIVRRVVDLHDADITLSEAAGGGLLVEVAFPIGANRDGSSHRRPVLRGDYLDPSDASSTPLPDRAPPYLRHA